MKRSSILTHKKEVLKINIFIQDKFVTSQDFSPDMLIAYLGLRSIIMKITNEYYVSIGLISYILTGKQIASQNVTKATLAGLKELLSKGYIIHKDKNEKQRANEWILDLKQLQIDKMKLRDESNYYSVVKSDYITALLTSDEKDKISLLRFYCYLMTTVTKTGEKEGVGFTSYENMAAITGVCRQTISKYMNKLESHKIIFIHRSTDSIVINGSVREIPNTYGDIELKDKVINVGKAYIQNYGENAKMIKSTRYSSSRSAVAKYNVILNDLATTGEIRYKDDELKEIYEVLLEHNERYKCDEEKQKDLSMFSDFDFYKG